MRKEVERVSDLVIGKRYHVSISDCCVEGDFIAELTFIHIDKGYTLEDAEIRWNVETGWSNGVKLTKGGIITEEEKQGESSNPH